MFRRQDLFTEINSGKCAYKFQFYHGVARYCLRAISTVSTFKRHLKTHLFDVAYFFYPRDAMLARVIVIATCLSVRPSVTRRYCVKTKKN